MLSKKFGFYKEERLTGKKNINLLFNSGNTFSLYPLKIYWIETDGRQKFPAQVLVNSASKIIRKTHIRNLATRRIKEAYRLKKHILYKNLSSINKTILIAYIYVSYHILPYKDVEALIEESFKTILKDLK
jgi:ribonuclease P protein component